MLIVHNRARPVCLLALVALAATALGGCEKPPPAAPPVRTAPRVQVARVQQRDIKTTVGQPGFIYAYEETALYPKVSGYLKKWHADIGDHIKEGEVLAEIDVPELLAQYEQAKAKVELDEVMVEVSQELVQVAENNVKMVKAQAEQAQAQVKKYQADVTRWESEFNRIKGMVKEKIIDQQTLEETRKQLEATVAGKSAAESGVIASEATLEARKADVAKARVDVRASQAKVKVAEAEKERLKALVGYTKILAPYKGRVVVRNANTGDFLQPATGDLSATPGTPDQPATRGTPIYVVARTDKVRVFVDVPENEADYVSRGTEAHVRIRAFTGADIVGKVARTSWALTVKTRTLRAEIDLPNSDARILPGMYVYGMVMIERPKVYAVPLAAVTQLGNQNVCYVLENGKAVKTPIQTGASDGHWIEVAGKKVEGNWMTFNGTEEVILGDLSDLVDGEPVQVTSTKK